MKIDLNTLTDIETTKGTPEERSRISFLVHAFVYAPKEFTEYAKSLICSETNIFVLQAIEALLREQDNTLTLEQSAQNLLNSVSEPARQAGRSLSWVIQNIHTKKK